MGVNARRRQLAPEPYSLGHLRVLFERLIDVQEGRGEGETTVVETLRAISEVVVFGENQDAKIAAKAAKAEEMRQSQKAEDSSPNGDAGTGGRVAENTAEAGGGVPAVIVEGATDIRRQDAFFELFCEKNMMSRFIELLRSPPSRYESSGDVSRSSMNSFGAPTWGTNGGLDALVRALTWGGDILGIGQQQQVQQQQGTSGSGSAGRGRLMPPEGGSARGSRERSSAEVQVQVIQTTSILVMNVKSDTSLFYLLSNNHVNDMIMFDFRLGDEEVLSHFASFLKTLSLRLNPNTVQFFLCSPRRRRHRDDPTGRAENSHSNGREEIRNDGDSEDRRNRGKGGGMGKSRNKSRGAEATGVRREESNKLKKAGTKQPQEHHLEEEEEATFPLYTKALEYICHSDFHVRIAALTVVLNIYKQRDPLVRAYLNGPAARSASLPDRLVGALRSQCLVLADRAMSAGMMGGASGKMTPAKGGAAMAVVDPGICRDSIAGLQDQVFYLEDVFSSGQGELNAQLCEALLSRLVRPMLLGDWLSGRPGAMFAQVALCALAQLFIVVTYPPLVRLLVLETLGSEGDGSYPSLLALLQGDREELCLGALVVIQALAQNRVVRVDLGLAHDFDDDDDDDAGGISAFDRSETLGDEGVGASEACPVAPGEGNRCSRAGNVEMRPLGPEILGSTVDALCRMLVPGDFSSSSDAAAVAKAGPRRHHLVLRLCGKVLASLAPPPSTSPDQDFGNPNVNMNAHVNLRQSAATAATGALPMIDEQRRAGGMEEGDGRGNLALDDPEAKGFASFARREAAAASDGRALRKASGQRETVLRRIGEAHSAAAAMVLRGLGGAEGASCVVVFEEEIREWSKRTDLDGAITNLPKMSSLILRWSLDNTSLSQRHQSTDDSQPPLGASQDARVEESEAMRRQRELRGSLQAFLEIRQVRRLLSGKGKVDPWVLRIAGLGPEAEEEPREGGSLDLGGRECLACSIPNPAPRLPAAAAGEDDRAGKVRKRRNGGAAALSVTAGAGRRGRSELYLVLDAKAFLLATPDRHRLSNGEVRSAAPLIHLAVDPDPADETRLHIRALSDRPVALMRPVTPPRLLKTTTSSGKPGAVSASGSQDKKAAASGTPRDGGVAAAGGGGAGSMCDKQAWACELVFENARSCRLARKHMEGRRLRLRSEKMKLITDLLEACVQGTDD